MSISQSQRTLVRNRANFACEFCAVNETSVGGLLTIDHFIPQSKGGTDHLDNLIYCCSRCNSYKQNYFPISPDAPQLWNPRIEPHHFHFITLDSGLLQAISPTGEFTLQRLRLNRPALIAYRNKHKQQSYRKRQLIRYKELILLLEQTNAHLAKLTEEQNQLLEIQQ